MSYHLLSTQLYISSDLHKTFLPFLRLCLPQCQIVALCWMRDYVLYRTFIHFGTYFRHMTFYVSLISFLQLD